MTSDGSTAEQPAATEIDLDAVVRELDAATPGTHALPVEALRACQRNREAVTPRLIEVLQEAVRLGKEGKERAGEAPFFAMFLLTEFRAKEALPVVMELFSLREPVLEGVLGGDTVTSIGKRVISVLGADQPELIESMILNRELDDYVRWEAAAALECLVRDERLRREEAVERLGRQLRAAMESGDEWGVTISVCELADLNPLEVQVEIKAAFERRMVDESIIGWGHFEDELLDPERPGWCPAQERERPIAIKDTVEELRGWYCFSENYRRSFAKKNDVKEHAEEPWSDEDDDIEFDESDFSFGPGAVGPDMLGPDNRESLTIHHEARRVGRNDPCPCGSGKKFKKCCLRRGEGV